MAAAFDLSDDEDDLDSPQADRRGLLRGARRDSFGEPRAKEEAQFSIGGDDSDDEVTKEATSKSVQQAKEFDDPLRNEANLASPQNPSSEIRTPAARPPAEMPGSYDFDRDFVRPPIHRICLFLCCY